MNSIPTAWGLQMALLAHLKTSAELLNYIGVPPRIYDNVPHDAVYPFITIGEVRMRIIDEVAGAREHDLRVNVYSKWGGRKEIKQLTDIIQTHLHNAVFEMAEHQIVLSRFIFADLIQQKDPDLYQGIIRFRIITEPNEAAV